MSDEKAYNIEFKDIINVVKRRFFIVILITIPTLLFGIYYGLSDSKVLYQARVSLIIGNYIDTQGTQFQIDDISRIQTLMGTYSAIAKTSSVAERTVKELKLKVSAGEIRRNISASPQTETPFLDLILIWTVPQEALDILDVFTDIYIEEARSIYSMYNIKIMERDSIPQKVVISRLNLFATFGFFAGIIISLLLIFALEFMNSKLNTEEDIEKSTGLPVLGLIPKQKKRRHQISQKSIGNLDHAVIEGYKTLRTNTFFASKQKKYQLSMKPNFDDFKTIVVTSSMPGEGKTKLASMLAELMAYNGKKIALIDCDLRKPDLHNIFDLGEKGLTNILDQGVEWRSVLNTSHVENLYILGAGIIPLNPSELLSSIRFKEVIDAMRDEFDYIVFDTPSVNLVTDAQVISSFVDGYLIVVSSGKSKLKDLLKTKKLIQYADGVILGVALNKITDQRMHKYYKYYFKNNAEII